MDIVTEAEIIALSRQFARRLVQEAEMQENAQELIARECAVWDALQAVPSYCERFASPLVINEQGEEMHTADRPFCSDMQCACHRDEALWQRYIYQPWLDGLMTIEAGAALFSGR